MSRIGKYDFDADCILILIGIYLPIDLAMTPAAFRNRFPEPGSIGLRFSAAI
ncbi:hypothetical protein [Burkholderia ubonensis]|uniref:hypothetical protein n=1 Tax=Burkholderia ubonensis TaxID=101571 RepID=UPI0012FCFA5E|nr:hypothetical protein [Burkholderia ubonensis]